MQVGYIYKHRTYVVCEIYIFIHTETQNYYREVLVLQYLCKRENTSEILFDFF